MAGKVRFVLNKKNFAAQILAGVGTSDMLESRMTSVAPPDTQVVVDRVGPRARARIYGKLSVEARTGYLSRALGVQGTGDGKMWYTTKAGKRRLVTREQYAHWTRGKGRRL